MKLEAGKSYRCRNGMIITLEIESDFPEYLYDRGSNYLYDPNCSERGHLVYGHSLPHLYDIISEVTDNDNTNTI